MAGGHSAPKQPTEEDKQFFSSLKDAVEAKTHTTYSTFEIHHLTS